MSNLQTIVDNAMSITIDRHKTSGQVMTRSGLLKTAQIATNIPWFFTVEMHSGLSYSENRELTEEIDRLDRTEESEINIGNTNPGLAYITRYRGDSTGISSVTINSALGSNIYLNCTSAGTGTYLFRKGDYIQPGSNYRYPYTVTADVPHSTSSNVTIPVSRPIILQPSYVFLNKTIRVGSNVSWRVKMMKKPMYSVIPYDRLEFSDAFQLVEVIESGA